MMEIPSFLQPYLNCDALIRLKGIDMNCGVQMTSFPLFFQRKTTDRYDHSLITALCAWHFTHDRIQSLACLFHDIATPVFSHTVDFAGGDYMMQESTEKGIAEILQNDSGIRTQLKQDGILIKEVCNYHMYPICDNTAPKLSCDRLSYLLTGMIELGFGTKQEAEMIFDDLSVGMNETGEMELCFGCIDVALLFAQRALQCGIIYSCSFDRYAMEELAQLLKSAFSHQILTVKDLYTTEDQVIQKLKNSTVADAWNRFTQLYGIQMTKTRKDGSLQVKAKKRYVDPYVSGKGRISQIDSSMNRKIRLLLSDDQSFYITGLYKNKGEK